MSRPQTVVRVTVENTRADRTSVGSAAGNRDGRDDGRAFDARVRARLDDPGYR